jgi:DNA-binding transcriptional ArsR family regulator
LADRYPMSFAAVQKHVAVLERAQLVHKRRRGREQLVRGDIKALRTVNRLLDQYETVWRSRIDQMDEILADHKEKRR